jgi:hypothetical protein
MDLDEETEYQFMPSSSVGSYAVPRYKADFAQSVTNSVNFENESIPDQGTIPFPLLKIEVDDTLHVPEGGVVKMEHMEEGEEIFDVVKTENDASTTKNRQYQDFWDYPCF